MKNVWHLALICAAIIAPIGAANATIVVDQGNLVDAGAFSFLSNGITSQSFTAGMSNSVGAGIFLSPRYASPPGTVTISLWTGMAGDVTSTMLASSSGSGLTGQWADVSWGQVGLTVGNTYNIQATGSANLVVSFGDQYTGGNASYDYGGSSFVQFPYDLTFRTFAETDAVAAVPEPATWAMMLLGFGGMGAALRRRRTRAAMS